jgi:hypothetical protein
MPNLWSTTEQAGRGGYGQQRNLLFLIFIHSVSYFFYYDRCIIEFSWCICYDIMHLSGVTITALNLVVWMQPEIGRSSPVLS